MRRRYKRQQCGTNILDGNVAIQVSSHYSGKAVVYIMQCLPFKSQWNILNGHDPYFPVSFEQADVTIFKDCGQSTFIAVRNNSRVMFIHGKQGNITFQSFFHGVYQVIISIEYGIAMRKTVSGTTALPWPSVLLYECLQDQYGQRQH